MQLIYILQRKMHEEQQKSASKKWQIKVGLFEIPPTKTEIITGGGGVWHPGQELLALVAMPHSCQPSGTDGTVEAGNVWRFLK